MTPEQALDEAETHFSLQGLYGEISLLRANYWMLRAIYEKLDRLEKKQ